jgi:hypothetical protein
MRVESRVFSVGWIPSEAVKGPFKTMMDKRLGAHYDDPPPAHIDDLGPLRDADAFRFANDLRAFAEFDASGTPVAWGYTGGLEIGVSTAKIGPLKVTVAAVGMPDLQLEPTVGPTSVTFTQTSGGRTGFPMPRLVPKPPWFRLRSPVVWSTLQLTLHHDGRVEHAVAGASPFPRHWIFDAGGDVVEKVGVAEWKRFLAQPSWRSTPWGDQDSPAVVAQAETAMERELAGLVMRGEHKPKVSEVAKGSAIITQGEAGEELYLVLDGIGEVEVDGKRVGNLGPGAIIGERTLLDGGPRTATVTALTAVRVASVPAAEVDRDKLAELARGHQRHAG